MHDVACVKLSLVVIAKIRALKLFKKSYEFSYIMWMCHSESWFLAEFYNV